MMKHCRKITALALAVVLLASICFVIPASAASESMYFRRYTGSSNSIVTGLKAIGVDSSYAFRSKIAAANHIQGYRGSASQNIQLLSLLKQGRLINPNSQVSTEPSNANYFARYCGASNSIVTALQAIGVDSSYAFRSKIAAANKIQGYCGSASQNLNMLERLKNGTLLKPNASSNTNQGSVSTTQTEENGVYYTYVTVTLNTASIPAWIESLMKAESRLEGIIVSKAVNEYRKMTIEEPLAGPPVNGRYPVRRTVINIPYQITFKLHTHKREMGFGATLRYAGGCFITMYKCKCGFVKDLVVWEIPLPDPSEFVVNQINQTIKIQSQQSYWINNMR